MRVFASGLGRAVRRLRDTALRLEGSRDRATIHVDAEDSETKRALLYALDARLVGRDREALIADDEFWRLIQRIKALRLPSSGELEHDGAASETPDVDDDGAETAAETAGETAGETAAETAEAPAEAADSKRTARKGPSTKE